jgi:hypothetical protein
MNYTEQEDNIIISCVQSNPSNISAAVEVAANKLINRNAAAISQRYYSKLRHNNLIAVASNKGVVHLGKNSIRRQTVPDAESVIDAMLFAAVHKLTKDKAIDFLLSKMASEAKANLLLRVANKVSIR